MTDLNARLTAADHLRGIDHASELAHKGWKVVPYLDRPDGKQMYGWQNAATTDQTKIDEWFGPGGKYEDCYVAVVPGLTDHACIDIDDHGTDQPNGFDTARDLKLPVTAMVTGRSKSGKGLHLWYAGTGQSKRIYPGIDRKSRSGLVRVVYDLPPIEDVFEALPTAYRIADGGSTARQYAGTAEAWRERYSGFTTSPTVSRKLDDLPRPFTGHDRARDWLAMMVRYAAEGQGGVPEAIEDAYSLWMDATHRRGSDPALEWHQLLSSAITLFGGELPPPSEHDHPSSFFDKGILSARVAAAVKHDLAVGADGQLWEYRAGVYRPNDGVITERMTRLLKDWYRRDQVKTVRDQVEYACNIPALPEVPNSDYINTRSGMVNWSTGELSRHDPTYLSTVQLAFDYDPAATCPAFDTWLNQTVPTDSQELVWEMIGYLMLSGNPLQVAFLLYGRAHSGKSTFLRLIEKMLGDSNVSHVTLRDISEGKFEVARIAGKTANIVGDIDSKYLDDAARFKQITGQDTVMGQHKFGQPFDFKAWAVPVFSANKLWQSGDTTEGYFRRWVIAPFPFRQEKSAGFNEEMLHAELAGIFNKALPALRNLMARKEFDPHGAALDLQNEFRREANPVIKWLYEDERVTSEAGNEALRATKNETFLAFKEWSGSHMGKMKFYQELNALGFKEKPSNGTRYFLGIKVADASMAELSQLYGV